MFSKLSKLQAKIIFTHADTLQVKLAIDLLLTCFKDIYD
jgi:hypothetical protein